MSRGAGGSALAFLFAAAPLGAVELGVRGDRFTIGGEPRFLLGISYYGALGASEDTIRRDLDDMKGAFDWIRVWATWAAFGNDVSAVDPASGEPRQPFLKKLERLVAECGKRGMIVNVTLSRGNGATGPERLQDHDAHCRAVETLVTALRGHENWYLDLANERNLKDRRHATTYDLKQLRELARKLDPGRLVTASHVDDLTRAEAREYVEVVGLDFLSIHRRREAGSPAETETKARECRAALKEMGKPVPVLYDEPFRRGFSHWEPGAGDYLNDLKGALAGGAAGWCFHNGHQKDGPEGRPRRSFDLREKRLFEQLDAEEKKAVAGIRAMARERSKAGK